MFKRESLCLLTLLVSILSPVMQAQRGAEVNVWLSKADRTSLFEEQPKHPHFAEENVSGLVITVDDATKFQTMDGFGFALTGGSAELLMQMSPVRRNAVLQELFATGIGSIGVSYLRVTIGSSDMNEHVFTYDDLPPGETDPQLAKFSLGPDMKDVVPVLKEILAINPKISILASPWSAPSWMKTNGLSKAGSLKPEDYNTYAQYFVRYLHAMASEGIPIRAVTIQNEPLNANNTPSMVMTASEESNFLADALGPALRKAGLATEVILYDHNCDRPDYPLTVLGNPKASQYATGSGFHLYGGSIVAMTQVHDEYPAKNLYFTEQMVTQENDAIPLKLANSVSRLIVDAPRNWSRNVLLWNLAADPHDNPHTEDGGCPVCQGAITLDGDQMTRNIAFYTVAHAAKFVRPGSIRIASDHSEEASLPNVAYTTPNHSIVLIVANPSAEEQAFHVSFHGKVFAAMLDAGAVATYVWR